MVFSNLALSALIAVIVPATAVAPSPSPSAAANSATLKTIITVKTTPYCNALAQHFNSALVPMVGNDRTLDQVNTNLLDINEAFAHPDFARRLLKARDQLQGYDRMLLVSLPPIQEQINALRDAQKVTSDAGAAKHQSTSEHGREHLNRLSTQGHANPNLPRSPRHPICHQSEQASRSQHHGEHAEDPQYYSCSAGGKERQCELIFEAADIEESQV